MAGDGGKMVGGMWRRGVIRFLRGLRDGGKVLLASSIGVMSLVVNAYLVWSSGDWSGGPYYELYKEVITVTAATAAVLIAIVIYSPEVVKVFGETFLAKRYAAGREEGVEIGRGQGREEGVEIGRGQGREEGVEIRNTQLLKFLEENPGATAKEVEEWARNGDLRRNGDGGGESRKN